MRWGPILGTGVDMFTTLLPRNCMAFGGGERTCPAMLPAAQPMPEDKAIPQEGSPMNPTAFPELRVASPRPDVEALRSAYLDLLALALCDLAGAGTMSVHRRLGRGVFARELMAEEMELRIAGEDWPLHGISMAGLRRLRDLRRCVEDVVADGVEGDLIETGCWRGGASIMMRATLDSLGAADRTLWVCDSFAGFPLPDLEQFPQDGFLEDLATFDFFAAPLEDVKQNFARFGVDEGVEFVPGFFDETLPGMAGKKFSVIRLDGDTYEATMLALDSLYAGLAVGGYLIIDDYQLIDECEEAVQDFRKRHGIEEPIEPIDEIAARWRRTSDAPIEIAEPPKARDRTAGERGGAQLPHARVPGVREIELEWEVGVLRHRLATAAHEIRMLRSGADAATVDQTELLPGDEEVARATAAIPPPPTDAQVEEMRAAFKKRHDDALNQASERI